MKPVSFSNSLTFASLICLIAILFLAIKPLPCVALDAKYNVILEKNPFDPERGAGQNAKEDEQGASPASEFKEKYAIYGVVIAGKSSYAYIKPLSRKRSRNQDEDTLRKVTEGDLVDGWKVTKIQSEGVSFESGRDSVFLKVFGSTKKERSSNKPVAIATPRPRPVRSGGRTNSASHNRHAKPEVFVLPDNKSGKEVKNPFLKALLDARKKREQQKNNKHR